jgi:hypothetical protein
MLVSALALGLFLVWWRTIFFYALPTFFTLYLVYGFIRPRIYREVRREIEEEEDEEQGEDG